MACHLILSIFYFFLSFNALSTGAELPGFPFKLMDVMLSSAPFPTASAKAVMPASLILLSLSASHCVYHIKQIVSVRRVRMPSLKA